MIIVAGSGYTKFSVGARRKTGQQTMSLWVDPKLEKIGRYGHGPLGVPPGTPVDRITAFIRAEVAEMERQHCPSGVRTLHAGSYHPYIWEGAPQISVHAGPMDRDTYARIRDQIGQPGNSKGDGFVFSERRYTHAEAEAHCGG
jgi:hypothetical protein